MIKYLIIVGNSFYNSTEYYFHEGNKESVIKNADKFCDALTKALYEEQEGEPLLDMDDAEYYKYEYEIEILTTL